MAIVMEKVQGSSLIAATGHDPETNLMHIEFTDGSTHAYKNVPAALHTHLRAGGDLGSVGKTFHREVRGLFESEPVVKEEG